jgi:hypothetical protein
MISFLKQDKTMDKKNQEDADREKIIELIYKNYHRGHTECNGEYYKPILHDQWKLFHISDDSEVSIISKEEYIEQYKPSMLDDSLLWKTEIIYIDIDDKLASAKIKIYNQKFGYTDYFNLMKINNSWEIVHKISQNRIPKENEKNNGSETDK